MVARVHLRLARGHAPLLSVTGRARSDDVLPHGLASPAARNHVVDGQPRGLGAAVLARPGVPGQDRLAGDLATVHVARDPDVADEPDHAGPREREALGVERSLPALDDFSPFLPAEDGG